jgi:hypothetical protein
MAQINFAIHPTFLTGANTHCHCAKVRGEICHARLSSPEMRRVGRCGVHMNTYLNQDRGRFGELQPGRCWHLNGGVRGGWCPNMQADESAYCVGHTESYRRTAERYRAELETQRIVNLEVAAVAARAAQRAAWDWPGVIRDMVARNDLLPHHKYRVSEEYFRRACLAGHADPRFWRNRETFATYWEWANAPLGVGPPPTMLWVRQGVQPMNEAFPPLDQVPIIAFDNDFDENNNLIVNLAQRFEEALNGQAPVPPPAPRRNPPREVNLRNLATDSQNVHTAVVSRQTNELQKKILELGGNDTRKTTAPTMCLANWLLSKHVVFAEVPTLSADILKYYSMKKVITEDDWLYRRLFNAVFQIIQRTDDEDGKRKELMKRFSEECKESTGMCVQGHLTRLCNVFAGFDNELSPPVPVGEILQQKIGAISLMEVSVEEKLRLAAELFAELKVTEPDQVAWREALEA